MSFDIALTGLRAASDDLRVTGNNIANASTTGFKSSRAEFGDVYAASVMGSGSNSIGTGVRLENVAQQFSQGSINTTQSVLDMAVSGKGFFIVRQAGETNYTRAGAFGVDNTGYVVSNSGARLQGFPADSNGNITGILGDLQIQAGTQPPQQTMNVVSDLNLDSSDATLASTGLQFSTTGSSIGVAQAGQLNPTATTLTTLGNQTPAYNYTAPNNAGFTITMSGATNPADNGSLTVALAGPTSSVFDLANQINAQNSGSATPIGATAVAVDQGGGVYRLQFQANTIGDPSTIAVSALTGTAAAGAPLFLNTGASTAGIAAVTNGYPAQSITITDSTGTAVTSTSTAGASAAQTATQLSALAGVSATATTTATLMSAGYVNTAGNMVLTLNGVSLTSNSIAGLQTEINGLSATSLLGISATLTGGNLVVTSATGNDLTFSIASSNAADQVQVQGGGGTLPVTINAGGGPTATVVGGTINLTLAQGYTASNPVPVVTGLFGNFTPATFTPIVINAFDPLDQATYNNATSLTVYDSLGNSHVMSQYFVKEQSPVNAWTMYVLIDGQNVGDPNPALTPPLNTVPSQASFSLRFNSDGSLNKLLSAPILISNWIPVDASGMPNGATGPQNVLAGGSLPIQNPPTSSNFQIDLANTTQYGSPFSVNNVSQDGYTTGQMSSLSIDSDGKMFARFTNGESKVLGQIALARFNNEQGLHPVGDTAWAESSDSGTPNIGAPKTSALGAVQSSALEDSNVDLTAELVQLIIAQRDYQANAKTIETANQTTQTIINLR